MKRFIYFYKSVFSVFFCNNYAGCSTVEHLLLVVVVAQLVGQISESESSHNFRGAFCLSTFHFPLSTVAGACSSVDIASSPKCRATIAIAAAIYGKEEGGMGATQAKTKIRLSLDIHIFLLALLFGLQSDNNNNRA